VQLAANTSLILLLICRSLLREKFISPGSASFATRGLKQLFSKLRSVCCAEPKCKGKDARFTFTSETIWIQAVITQLSDVNNGTLSMRQQHAVRLQAAHTF
jgi:hypothetical protein